VDPSPTIPRYEEPSAEQRRDFLIASHMEIRRVLAAVQARAAPVAVYFGEDEEEEFIASRIVEIDPDDRWVALAFGPDKAANTQVRTARRLLIACSDEDAKIEFSASRADDIIVAGLPAFRVAFPAEVVRLRRRRGPRYNVPPHGPVQIVLHFEGVGDVDARIVDMSVGGIGVVSYPPDVRLAQDEVITKCTLRLPSGNVLVNVKVMHSNVIRLERGERVRHTGCRIIGKQRDLKALLDRFIVALSDA
jgi:c-di-GMP-binding flagellar brake protein YcgR